MAPARAAGVEVIELANADSVATGIVAFDVDDVPILPCRDDAKGVSSWSTASREASITRSSRPHIGIAPVAWCVASLLVSLPGSVAYTLAAAIAQWVFTATGCATVRQRIGINGTATGPWVATHRAITRGNTK